MAITRLTGTFIRSGSIPTTALGGGVVSSSAQIVAGLPAGTVSSSTQIDALLPAGTISSSNQVITLLPENTVSSSTQVIGFLPTGTVSSSTQYPGWVTSSTQIDYTQLQNIPVGIASSSAQIKEYLPTDTVSSSAQVTAFLPSGTVSSSTQLPAGIASSSAQVKEYLPTDTVSSSAQVTAFLPTGTVSGSSQISLSGITGTTFATADFTFPQNLTVAGTLTAEVFQTEYLTSSIIYESGSTKFGDTADDTHQFTGSLLVQGPISASGITGSFSGSGAGLSNLPLPTINGNLSILQDAVTIPSGYTALFVGPIDNEEEITVEEGGRLIITDFESTQTAVSSSFATTASYAVNGGWLRNKAGSIANGSFAGTPRKAAVNFTTAFPNTSYAVVITGEDARTWTIEGKVAGGFTASANSNVALDGTTYWVATTYGET